MGQRDKSKLTLRRTILAIAVNAAFSTSVLANPSGGTVAAGTATISRAGSTLTVTNSPGAIINWQQFSIQKDEITRFIQQNASSSVLNRVTGQNPSLILGQLSSNGRVFLINPSGIAFGKGAVIDVAGFAASTLNISDADFVSGRMRFQGSGAEGKLTNAGTIRTTEGGHVYLIAPNVENEKGAVITSPKGEVVIAAGKTVELVNSRTPDLRVELAAPDNQAVNAGDIVAASGRVGIYGTLIRNSGRVSASRAEVGEGGRIIFKATKDVTLEATSRLEANGAKGGAITVQADAGTVLASGTIEAKGEQSKGGEVRLLGTQVGLIDQVLVDVSGELGGGTALIGGDFQGNNAAVQNAQLAFVSRDTVIRADARAGGDGGKVVIWADGDTRFYGAISARGGAASGDGGNVEVSGKETLTFKGNVDTRAPNGRTGNLLLDPLNITIQDGTGDGNDADALNNSFAGAATIGTVAAANANPTLMFQSELQGIAATTNISLQATAAITIDDLTNNNLNLAQTAANSVSFSSATFAMNAGDTITTAGGALNITTTAGAATLGSLATNGGALNVTTTGGGATLGSVATNGGAITLNVSGASSVSGAISGTGTSLIKSGAGTLTLSGANTYTGLTRINAGVLSASTLANGGVASSIGQSGAGAANLVLGGGTLQYTGATATSDRAFTLIAATNSSIDVAGGTNLTISGASAATTGALTKVGSGTLTLSGLNAYTGATTINAGVLSATTLLNGGLASSIGASTNVAANLVLGGGTLQYTGASAPTNRAFTLTAATTSSIDVATGTNLTISGAGAATTGALTKVGSGTLTLSGANAYTGATTISAGTLALGAANRIADTSALVVNGTFDMNGFSETVGSLAGAGTVTTGVAGTVTLSAGNATNTTFSGVAQNGAGTLSLTKLGTGTLTLSGANTYTGATTVTAGTLQLGAADVIADASALTVTGTFDMNGFSETVGSLAGAGGVTSSVAQAVTLTAGGNNSNTTYSGVAQNGAGTLSLTKQGSGTLTLSGANTYTGITAVSAGTLTASNVSALGSTAGGTTVASGATLNINNVAIGAEAVSIDGIGMGAAGALQGTGAGASLSGAVTLSAPANIGVAAAGTLLLTGGIGGAGPLIQVGTGTLALGTTASTYTGATTIGAGGTLRLQSAEMLPDTTALTVTGTLNLNGFNETLGSLAGAGAVTLLAGTLTAGGDNSSTTYSGVMSGTGGLTKLGSGTLTLSGANTYTGATTISAGTLALGAAANRIADTSALVVNGTFDMNGFSETVGSLAGAGLVTSSGAAGAITLSAGGNGTSTTFSGVAQNGTSTLALTKLGAGTLTLSGANTYTGATTVTAGTLQLGAADVIADASALTVTGTLDMNGFSETVGSLAGAGSVTSSVAGAVTLTAGGNNTTTAYSGVAQNGAGTLSLTKLGTGTLTLSGANTYTGTTTVTLGTLALGAANRLADTSSVVVNGGTFGVATFAETVGAVQLQSGSITGTGAGTLTSTTNYDVQSGTISAILGGAVGLDKSTGGTVTLSGANTYTGTTTISTGTLRLGAADRIANTSALVVNGTFDMNGFSETVGSLAGTGLVTSSGAAGAITLSAGGNGTSTTFSGVAQNGTSTLALTKLGAGTLTLSGANTYTGATTVTAGTLQLGAADVIADASALTVTGTLDMNGFSETVGSLAGAGSVTSSVAGAVTLTAGGNNTTTAYSGVAQNGAGTLSLTKLGTGTLTLSGANTYTGTTTVTLGTLALGAANRLADTSSVVVNGGTFGVATFAETVGAVQLQSGSITGTGAGTLTSTTNYDVQSGTISAILGGAVGLDKSTGGTVTLSGANTYTGTTTISTGTLRLGAADRIANTSALVVNGTFDMNGFSETVGSLAGTGLVTSSGAAGAITLSAGGNGTSTTFSGVAQNGTSTLALTKLGAGTLTLSGANTYTGATTVTAGTLQLGAADVIADASALTVTGTLDMNGFSETVGSLAGAGSVTSSVAGAVTLTAGGNNTTTAYSGVAQNGAGTLSLTKLGTGTLTLSGANTYTGTTTVTLGTLALGAANRLADTSSVVVNGGTFGVATFAETVGAVQLQSGSITGTGAGTLTSTTNYDVQSGTISAILGGAVGLDKSTGGTVTLSGANTYTGTTTISTGTLRLGAADRIANTSALVVNGTFDMNGFSETVGSLAGTGLVTSSGAAGAITLSAGGNGTSTTFSGVAQNGTSTLALTKLGAGTLTLSGANTYTGATTVTAGTLQLGAADVIADASALTVTGTLDMNGFSETVGSLAGAGSVTSSVAGAVTLTAGGNNTTTAYSGVAQNGAGTLSLTKLGTGTLTLSGANTYTGATNIDAGTLTAAGGAAIPNTSQVNLADVAGAVLNLGASETIGNLSGGGTTGGNVTLGANALTVTEAGTTTYAGVISGTGSLTKAGAGTLTLSSANTYSGATNVNVGTLAVTTDAALGTAPAGTTVAAGATLDLQNVLYTTAEGLTLNGGTLLTSTGTSSYAGAVALGPGGGTLSVTGTQLTLSGAVSGVAANSLTKTGTGTAILSGSSTYAGTTTVSAGTLAVTTNDALGASTNGTTVASGATLDLQNVLYTTTEGLTLNGGTLLTSTGTSSYAGTVALGVGGATMSVSGAQLTLSGVISGATDLTKTGAGIAILSGNNTYSGATNVNVGTLAVTANNALGSNAAGTAVASGATLDLRNVLYTTNEGLTLNGGTLLASTGTSSFAGGVTLGSDSQISVTPANALTVSGSIQGSGGLNVTGGGSLTLAGAIGNSTALAFFTSDAATTLAVNGGSVTTSGDQTYGGATTFGAATLLASTGGNIGASGAVTATAGTLTLNAADDVTFNHTSNNLGTVQVIAGGDASLVDADGMTLGTSFAGTVFARTLAGNLTLGGNVAAGGSGSSIVLVAGGNFLNPSSRTLSPGAGRWLVYSTTPTADTPGVTPNFKHYGLAYSGAYGGGGTGNGLVYSTAALVDANLTGTTSKIYDGALSASLTPANYTVSGAFTGDTVLLDNPTVGAYLDKNVGTGKSVSTTVSIASASAGGGAIAVYGYTLNSTTASGNIGDISARSLTVSATGVNKVYDGLLGATVTYGDDRIAGDVLTASGAASFLDKNVGNAKTVNVSGIGLTGADAANYTFNTTTSTSANITARALAVSATGVNKVYDGLLGASVTYSDDRIAGDVLTASGAASFLDKNVGNAKTVNVSGIGLTGADAGNYTFNATTSTSANITARALAVTASGVNKVYDGLLGATVTYGDDRIAGDVLTASGAASFLDKNVGNAKTINVSGIGLTGADAGNYTFNATASTSANITARALAVTATGQNKVYDGLLGATVTYGDDRIAGDVLAASGAASFLDKNVGNAKTVNVSGIGLTGADAGNYTFNANTSTSANITARAITVTAQTDTRIYDATQASTVLPTVSSGTIAVGDSAAFLQTFDTKHVASGKTLAASGVVSDGNGGGNYAVTFVPVATGEITPVALAVSATGVSKVYDGLLGASVTYSDNRIAGDVFTASGAASFLDKNVGVAKTINVSGIGLTGADAGNYTFNVTTSTSANITARALAVTATGVNKVYDGLLGATVTYGDDRIAGDVLTASGAASFLDKNVGNAKTVNVSGIGLTGADAGNYTFNATASTSANITARALAITATGQNKVYDGLLGATVTYGDDRIAGDVLTASGAASFLDKNVGNAKTVNVSGIGLTGADAGNYTFNATASTSANITARALAVTATGQNKVYDGLLGATVTYGDDRIAGDVLTASGAASFLDKNVGVAKTINVSGIGLTGTDAANYTFNTTTSTSANITARALAVTASGQNKVYDGLLGATVTYGDDRIAGDVLTASGAASFLDKNVGVAKTINVSGIGLTGTDAANYTFNATTSTSANITARALAVTATGQNKVYDGLLGATVTYGDDRIAGDVLTASGAASFLDKNVGNAKTVNVSGIGLTGADAGNYTFNATTSTSANITARALAITATGQNKVYDGLLGATVTYGDDRIAGDVLTASGAASFLDKNVGNAKTVNVSGIGLTGADAGNYTFNATTSTSANITARALAVSATGQNKVYDGLLGATVTYGDDRIAGDVLSASGAASFLDKNVGNAKTVNVSGIGLTGADAGNYTFNTTTSTSANITARAITVTALTDTKVYDGATSSAVNPLVSGGLGAGDTGAFLQAYDTRNVGTTKTLTASGAVNDGNGGGNYAVTFVTNSTGVITAQPITVTAQAQTRTYDGTAISSVAPAVAGTLYDAVGTAATQTFDTKHVGTGKTLTASGLVLNDGNGGANYNVTYVTSTGGRIDAAALTVTAQAQTRVYDGTVSSSVAPVVTGTLYDSVGTAATQTFDTKHVATGKTLTAGGLVVSDGNGGNNYSISYVVNTGGTVTARPITVTAQADTKTYDATVASMVNPLVTTGSVALGDSGAFLQVYDTTAAATGKTLTASGTVSDGNGGNNYAVTFLTNTSGVINPAGLTISANNASRPIAQANPPFSASYSGLQGGDSPSSLTGSLLYATPADPASPAGNYAITPSGLTSANYSIVFVPGTLTVFGTTAVVPDPLATSYGALRSPVTAASGATASTVGRGIFAAGSDDEPGAQFLNGLPPSAAGQGGELLPPLDMCGSFAPFAVLRCGGQF